MRGKKDTKRAFYVVQFIELPFEGVEDYVCVPHTWLILRRATNNKAVVAYPSNEDPFDKRDRAKRKERCNDDWRFYMTAVKYESDSYNDAELWITMRNNCGPLVEVESDVTEPQPKLSDDKKVRSANQNHNMSKFNARIRKPLPRISIKRPAKSELTKEIEEKRLKLDESAQSSSAVVNDAKVESRSPKRKQSVTIQDNQLKECSQAEESPVASNADESTEPRSKTPRTEQTEQALSSPIKEVEKRTEVINIDDADHAQRVKMTAAKPSTAAEQSTQPNQYNNHEYIPDRSLLSNFQPQIENVRSLANVDDHKLLVSEVSSQKLSNSYIGLDSLKRSAILHSHMNSGRRLIPTQRPVEISIRPTKMESNLVIATQNPSNSVDQTRHLSTRSVEQPAVVTQNQSQIDPQFLRTYTGNIRDRTAPLRSIGMITQEIHGPRINFERSNSFAAVDSRNVHQSVNNAAATSQQLPSLSHMPPSYTRRSDGHQNSVAHEQYCMQNQYLPTNQDNFQKELLRGFTESNTYNHRPTPQTINMRIPLIRQMSTSTNTHAAAHENGYQNLCTQEQLVDQSTRTNSKTKRVRFVDDDAGLPVIGSHLNVMENACQTDEWSPYHAVTSDSDTATDPEVISDHEMSTDEAPAETTNNVYGTANDPGHGSTDRPSAAQNSTARSHQMNPKFVLEQQMLDNFATLFTQMGSTLRYTTDMYNTLRSSILDTAETYKKLLRAVEQFNSAGNAASNASLFNNLIPNVPQSSEKRHPEVTASASSSNQDERSNDAANKEPKKKHKKYRFVLPPEYDAFDSRWTLKYRTNTPGLVELVPQSGVYVCSGDLRYCQQVSKNCKSLALRLLPEVFKRDALSICSSMSETAEASNSGSTIRPDLDDHACSVLLNFVLEHGLQRGWNTDLKPILSTLHRKQLEIRCTYGVMVECE